MQVTGKEARATQKFLRFSPRRGHKIVWKIRRKHVDQAIAILQFSPQKAARETLKVLKSAIANATKNHGMKAENLFVKEVLVDKAPSFKRIVYRARGRADRMARRNNHTTIVLGEIAEAKAAVKGEPAGA